jgi:hypothetical protein
LLGTPRRPCRLSWINGGSRRTHPKGKASSTEERGQAQEHFAPDDAPPRNVVPVSPLSVELESAPWPRRFNANTLPQYNGDYDPKEFLMKFEAAVESNGGDSTTKAKALMLALKGEVQY